MAIRTVAVDHLVGFLVAAVKTNTNELKFKSKSNFNFNKLFINNNNKFNKLRAYSTTPKTSSSNYIFICTGACNGPSYMRAFIMMMR
jgi:hypothetical protein